MKQKILSIIISGIWITASEFVRNEFIFKYIWVKHYNSLGLTFTTAPLNGIFWLVWSFIFAYLIYALLQKFSFGQTVWLAWLAAFVMMWLTIYNLQVLPLALLLAAVPLSLLEAAIAGLIIKKLLGHKADTTSLPAPSSY